MISRFGGFLKYCLQYACVTHCTFEYIGDFVVCNGPSMEPTLYSNNVLVTERISVRFHRPHRGDIIIAVSPTNPTQYICKRIMGIPGDKVVTTMPPFSEQKLDTTDTALSEIKSHSVEVVEEIIPRGYVWLEGDNSQNSSDSRYYGPIPLGLIKSRVICRLWPIAQMRML